MECALQGHFNSNTTAFHSGGKKTIPSFAEVDTEAALEFSLGYAASQENPAAPASYGVSE